MIIKIRKNNFFSHLLNKKHEKITSPTKKSSESMNNKKNDSSITSQELSDPRILMNKSVILDRNRIVFVLENLLYFLFTQTILFINQSSFTIKEKKNFKRDLLTEIVNFSICFFSF